MMNVSKCAPVLDFGPQRFCSQLVPLLQYKQQCGLPLNIRQVLPVRDEAQRAVAVDHHRLKVIKLGALPAAHIELDGFAPRCRLAQWNYLCRRALSGCKLVVGLGDEFVVAFGMMLSFVAVVRSEEVVRNVRTVLRVCNNGHGRACRRCQSGGMKFCAQVWCGGRCVFGRNMTSTNLMPLTKHGVVSYRCPWLCTMTTR
jgi:hypothetical protein